MHIRFHVGGPAIHPTAEQAALIARWLGPTYTCSIRHDAAAFDDLGSVDCLVLMGMFWPGMSADWAGNMTYDPLPAAALERFFHYTRAKRPLAIHHGAIGCYTDQPAFTAALGVQWGPVRATHSPEVQHHIRVASQPHPITAGVQDFAITDELYHSLVFDESRPRQDLLWGSWEGNDHPLLTAMPATATHGAHVFHALGHGLVAFSPVQMRQLWVNSIAWLTHGRGV